MGFIESLNKFGKKISVQKTDIYIKIEEAKSSLEALGLNMKIKSEFDLFDYEIIYRGLLTQNILENAYELFYNSHYDLLDYLNYEEKRKMFNNDIQPLLEKAPHFYDAKNDTEIYIPYLEAFVNKRYTDDYQILLLKQHKDYVKNYQISQKSFLSLYGDVYRTEFSSLINVYEDERHLCYYYDEFKTIYIFKKDTNELLNKVIIQDQNSTGDLNIEDVKKVASYIEAYQYQACLDLLKEKELIGEKTYKKVLKKYK